MANEDARRVYGELREAQNRYTYFLLAASASAIAFSVTRTEAATLEWAHMPLGLAAISWAASFYNGCVYLRYVQSNLVANLRLLSVQSGDDPEVGRHPGMIEAASEGIRNAFDSNNNDATRSAERQFRYLILGGMLFVVWHVIQMGLRSGG